VRHTATAKMKGLVRTLRAISLEIEPQVQLVSQAARDEWSAPQAVWPSDEELREGTTALAEGELEAIEVKVRRFREIVQGLGSTVALRTTGLRRAAVRARRVPSSRSAQGGDVISLLDSEDSRLR
jgi:hypothetical protein